MRINTQGKCQRDREKHKYVKYVNGTVSEKRDITIVKCANGND